MYAKQGEICEILPAGSES